MYHQIKAEFTFKSKHLFKGFKGEVLPSWLLFFFVGEEFLYFTPIFNYTNYISDKYVEYENLSSPELKGTLSKRTTYMYQEGKG